MFKRLTCTVLTASLLIIAFTACNNRKETTLYSGSTETPPAALLKVPFQEPMEPVLFELPAQALATWRDYAKYRPVLVLFSAHPLLNPIPDSRRDVIHKLLKEGPKEEIVRRATVQSADTAVLNPETLSAAIANGLFSEIVLVLPNKKKAEDVSLAGAREQMVKSGFLSEAEASELILENGTISGKVRGIPLRIPYPGSLPQTNKPIILHIDLGFFSGMYINEIKTPSYELLYNLANNIKVAAYPALATTLSFSNQEEGLSLESRFLLRDLAATLRKPEMLSGTTPQSWAFRASALYKSTMFSEEGAREATEKAVLANPEDAAAQYAFALDLFKENLPDKGFSTLDRAVALDPGYALQYLILAEQGVKMNQRAKVLELYEKTAKVFPDNPFVRIGLVNQLIQSGRVKDARPHIAELRKLEWSQELHPEIPDLLKQMDEAAAIDSIIPPPVTSPKKPSTPPQQKPAGSMPGFNHMGMGVPNK